MKFIRFDEGKPALYLLDSFDEPHGIMHHYLNNPVQLIDVGQIADDDLSKQKLAGVIQGALKYSRASEPEKKLIKLIAQLNKLDFSSEQELKLALRLITTYIFAVADNVNTEKVIAASAQIPNKLRGEYMTIAEGLEARGIVKGHCEIATNALSKGYAIETVIDLTGLDLEVVEQLKRDLYQFTYETDHLMQT